MSFIFCAVLIAPFFGSGLSTDERKTSLQIGISRCLRATTDLSIKFHTIIDLYIILRAGKNLSQYIYRFVLYLNFKKVYSPDFPQILRAAIGLIFFVRASFAESASAH